jgi:hypothetical protein
MLEYLHQLLLSFRIQVTLFQFMKYLLFEMVSLMHFSLFMVEEDTEPFLLILAFIIHIFVYLCKVWW